MALSAKKKQTATSTALVVPMIPKDSKTKTVLGLIEDALTAAKSVVTAVQRSEPHVQKALVACVSHFAEHKDARPADRLVKGLMALNHPAAMSMAREVVAHFRTNSPIRWDAKGKLTVLKEGQEGYKAPDAAAAEETNYYETPQAKRARSAAEAAHKNNLKEADLNMVLKRTAGSSIGFINNILRGKDERKIKEGELPKIKRFAARINEVLKEFGGDTAVVEIAKPERKAA